MSDHPDNIIAESLTPEMDAELLAATPKADGFPSFGCYQMIQCGYPLPDHGEMILRPFGDMDERGYLLPPKSEAMWVKREDAENLQSRLTAAETRVKELEKVNEQVELWKIENESRAILIHKYHKIIGYDNFDGFHSEPSPEQMLTSLKTALAAAKEALGRIATQYPIDDGEEVKSLARHKCEQARDALARIAECEKGT